MASCCGHSTHALLPLNNATLQGLSRLLELLFEWFNVTLGEMLVGHLRKALDPEGAGGLGTGRPEDEVQIAAGILSLFHLLPSWALRFLETQSDKQPGLVVLTIQLEERLAGAKGTTQHPRVMWSPYRWGRQPGAPTIYLRKI